MASVSDRIKSVVDLVRHTELGSVAADLSEVGLDAFLEEGVLKEIPAIGILAKLGSTVGHVSDLMLARKLARFLTELNKVPEEERRKQIDRLSGDPQEKLRVGEHLLSTLEKLDDSEKAEKVANAFVWYLSQQIDLDTLRRIDVAIERCHLADLRQLAPPAKCPVPLRQLDT